MDHRSHSGHAEAALIRRVNPAYAAEALKVLKMLKTAQPAVGQGVQLHLSAVEAGLRGEEVLISERE